MKFIVNGIKKEITLRAWDEDIQDWGWDVLYSFEHTYAFIGNRVDGEAYAETVAWWDNEVKTYNAGKCAEWLGDPTAWNAVKKYRLDYDNL